MTCILIVEDEGQIRDLLVEVISEAGYDIIEAATADDAVKLLDIESLRLIVSDINLPGRLDGIDLAVAARRAKPGIPVLFISGRPDMLRQARLLSDPTALISKPFSLIALVDNIERLAGAP